MITFSSAIASVIRYFFEPLQFASGKSSSKWAKSGTPHYVKSQRFDGTSRAYASETPALAAYRKGRRLLAPDYPAYLLHNLVRFHPNLNMGGDVTPRHASILVDQNVRRVGHVSL